MLKLSAICAISVALSNNKARMFLINLSIIYTRSEKRNVPGFSKIIIFFSKKQTGQKTGLEGEKKNQSLFSSLKEGMKAVERFMSCRRSFI